MAKKLFINDIDRTADLQRGTLNITSQLNNRKDTMRYKVFGDKVNEGEVSVLYHGSYMIGSTLAGVTSVVVDDIYADTHKFRVGQELIIDPEAGTEEKRTITAVDDATSTITFTPATTYAHSAGIFIGKKLFAGVVVSQPDKDIGLNKTAGMIEYNVTVNDFATLMDLKVVNESFQDQYAREIIGRMVYEFVANDTEQTVDGFNYQVDLSDTATDTAATIGDVSGTLKSYAKKITPVEGQVIGVQLYKDESIGSPQSDLRVSIQTDSAGSPSGTEVDGYDITPQVFASITEGTLITIPLAATLTPATNYWIVAETTDDGTDIGYSMKFNAAGSDGKSRDGVGAWAVDTKALSFRTLYSDWTLGGVADGARMGIAQGGVDDRIEGNNALQMQFSGAGTGTLTKTLSVAIDATNETHARFWHKVGDIESLTGLTFRIGSDASNYYEWSSDHIEKEVWHYESFEFSKATATGTPVKTALDYVYIAWTVNAAVNIGDIAADVIQVSSGGNTLKNVSKGTKAVEDMRVQFKKPSVVIERLAKTILYFWYVDNDRDIHFFANDAREADFEITCATDTCGTVSLQADLAQVKNRQTVRGGLAPEQTEYTQNQVNDGEMESWRLDFPPKGLRIFVSTTGLEADLQEKTVGVENLVDDTQYDYTFNFAEKHVLRASDAIIPDGGLLRMTYLPYKPVRVRVSAPDSISALAVLTGGDGIYDGSVINDQSLRTFEDARQRAQAEVDTYKNPILTFNWNSDVEGLNVGEIVKITNGKRGLAQEPLQVQKISYREKDDARFNITVTASTTLFGLQEFFILLLERDGKGIVDEEVVDIVLNMDETISIADDYTFTAAQQIFYAMGYEPDQTPRDAYSEFSETCGGTPSLDVDRVTTAT